MNGAFAIATAAIIGMGSHTTATAVHSPHASPVAGFAIAPLAVQNNAAVWDGRWQGTTAVQQALVLELKVQGDRLIGRLSVGKQSATITESRVVEGAFALVTGPIDGNKVQATGRRMGEALELTIEGVKDPLTLTRLT
jgi:hypothetical protein